MSTEQVKGRILAFFRPFGANALLASLAYSLVSLGINWPIAYMLYKKKTFVKL